MPRRFDADYRETVVLKGSTEVVLRLVRPDDKPLFVAGFARLSPESRYFRFFTGKDHLTDAELRYLTELDGENHLAIGALGPDGQGAGVARFIRLAQEPEVAELAVTVVDSMQRKGLGRILSERLMAAARERGVKRLRAEILAENRGMLALIDGQVSTRAGEGTTLIVDLPVTAVSSVPEAPAAEPGPLDELLRLAARRLLSFRRAYERKES